MVRFLPCVAPLAVIAVAFSLSPLGVKTKRRRFILTCSCGALKKALTGSDGLAYFEKNLRQTELPPLIGTLVSASPSDLPSVLLLRMYDSDQPEVTLRLIDDRGNEAHMPGQMAPGSQINFEGIGVSFTQDPFMLTFKAVISPPAR